MIRETPLVSQRQHQSSDSMDGPQHATMASSQAAASKPTLQATDVKQQLLAKLATKQAHPVQGTYLLFISSRLLHLQFSQGAYLLFTSSRVLHFQFNQGTYSSLHPGYCIFSSTQVPTYVSLHPRVLHFQFNQGTYFLLHLQFNQGTYYLLHVHFEVTQCS